ncbi:phospholipase D-like domain-containing protein [Nannocystis bainbridge]|uniref:Phospholipase D-like domain-containing protein n=1 Tax=Nannocystis bainbridge TaxID=2995303 RepID=A0ABT5EB71_9BACT|nr:phospholipase D-like domain-containing protein [Nannocystis bainbridge]MDC0723115.1 phospholipase D-like domain-containing protein [Nannocystis bainbridge]
MHEDDGLLAIADDHGPYPVRDGNRVVPWIDGLPFFERLAAAVAAARTRLWVIVSFIQPDFRLPDGLAWWDLLDRCHARGLDVRVLFWRNPRFSSTRHVFLGGPAERQLLAARRAGWAARWDSSAEPAHCHHQKAFLVDAGQPDALAFVGGMILSDSTLARPGHHHGLHKHDAFLELQGPVVADAEHNFVQRWNLARQDPDAPPWPDDLRAGPLAYPGRLPPACGDVRVQLARTLAPDGYRGPTPIVGAPDFASDAGEATILAHYLAAIAAARRTIYIENQHPGQHAVLLALDAALRRGVRVVMVVPGEPMAAIGRAAAEVAALARDGRTHEHRYGPTFAQLNALAQRPGFTLAALARSDADGHREIYTHAKLCIVDGAWATLGSANLVDLSLDRDHTELNAAWWGRAHCLPLLLQLVAEHTDLAATDDLEALGRFAAHARASRDSLARGGPILAGCYALDPATYGLGPPLTAGA